MYVGAGIGLWLGGSSAWEGMC